jgi:hypothetical protein
VVEAYDKFRDFVGRLNPESIREAVEKTALVTRSDPTLFELYCTFAILDELGQRRFHLGRFRLIRGTLQLPVERRGRRIVVHYQAVPRELKDVSRYADIAREHGLSGSMLIPDLVLEELGRPRRYLIIEAKLGDQSTSSGRSAADSARAALKDLLMYRRDYSAVLGRQDGPIGLGLAWGRGLRPATSEIMLATPDSLGPALGLWLDGDTR